MTAADPGHELLEVPDVAGVVPPHQIGLDVGGELEERFPGLGVQEVPRQSGDVGGPALERREAHLVGGNAVIQVRVSVTYRTEKVVYYGGEVTFPLVARHPSTGETSLRFAEPVETDLNRMWLELHGLPPGEHAAFLRDLRERLYDPAVCLAHTWKPGDVVMTDNHALLHGRRAYTDPGRRHLRRVNIL
jgi:hypothetical protein